MSSTPTGTAVGDDIFHASVKAVEHRIGGSGVQICEGPLISASRHAVYCADPRGTNATPHEIAAREFFGDFL
jgi:hypothetical protein